MPKSVDPARPAQAGLRCLLSGTDRCDENGGNRRCRECSLSARSAELVSFFTNFRTLPPALQSKKGQDVPIGKRERILPLRAPFATTVWDFIRRGMPLGAEGTLTADEVYALTAYLLVLNKVIPEDHVLDEKSLPKVKMPIGDDYARLPDWKPGTRRLEGYPY
jgi:hypothetical protein